MKLGFYNKINNNKKTNNKNNNNNIITTTFLGCDSIELNLVVAVDVVVVIIVVFVVVTNSKGCSKSVRVIDMRFRQKPYFKPSLIC